MIIVNCLCLKGFGNNLVNSLLKYENVKINKIYSRSDDSKNFYYPIESLEKIAEENNIPIQFIENSGSWEIDTCDLIISSTFHRILKIEHIKSAKHVINIHPSLLPCYKGATPTNWQVYDDVKITGVSAHLITSEEVDSGPVIAQKKIFNPSMTDWQLRMTLAKLSEFLLEKIIDDFPNYKTIKEDISYKPDSLAFTEKKARNESDATYRIKDIKSLDHLGCLVRAFDNYPNLRIRIDNRTFMVKYSDYNDLANISIDGQEIILPGRWISSE